MCSELIEKHSTFGISEMYQPNLNQLTMSDIFSKVLLDVTNQHQSWSTAYKNVNLLLSVIEFAQNTEWT